MSWSIYPLGSVKLCVIEVLHLSIDILFVFETFRFHSNTFFLNFGEIILCRKAFELDTP